MDLQAILDASDSSEEEEQGIPSYRFSDVSSGHMDLEQILRQDDLEDDDENGDDTEAAPHLRVWENKQEWNGEKHEIVNKKSHVIQNPSHSAEDWAILQAILNGEDEEEDIEEDWMDTPASRLSLQTTQDRLDVDALLQSSAADDEEDFVNTSTFSMTVPTVSSISSPPRSALQQDVPVSESGRALEHTDVAVAPSPSTLIPEKAGEKIEINDKMLLSPPVVSEMYRKQRIDDRQDEESSRRALAQAQANERKLLRSGHREIVSPLMVKRRLKPKVELTSRTQKLKAQVSSRLATSSGPRFGFSGIVENKSMTNVSASIVKHSHAEAKVPCGLPTCLAFNSKFIAVGTQLGIILIYDLFEVLRQRLGAPGHDDNFNAKKAGSITSLDLSYNGEAVVAGYTSGILVLWDTIRGVVLRTVSESHPSPITSVRFLSDLKMVTVDAGGLVNKLAFTKNILWTNYSMESECLLDGTAGQILAMSVLPPYSTVNPLVRPEALSPILRKLTLIALSSERSSFAVAVEPVVNVLHRWARPPGDRTEVIDGSVDLPQEQMYLPCLSWGWALISGGGNVVMPILARAWGCCLQLLCASFPTLDGGEGVGADDQSQLHWPAFGVHDEIDAGAPIVALNWLGDRSLVYLTVTNEFSLIDTVMVTLLERLDFSGLKLVYAEFSLSRSVSTKEAEDEDEATSCTTFQNSIRCSDDRLFVLCQDDLKCISVVGTRRRISALEEDGEWLEALALALDHYESTVVSQEDRKRDPYGKKDLSRHPEFSAAKSEDEEWIAKLLIRYLNLAVENAPEPSNDQVGTYSLAHEQSRIDLARSHFQMLAGVCVEFCVVIRRLDLLYGPIFRRFQSVGYTSVFLDVLEPYVLNDKLSYIAPEVMSFFVEHCKATNGIDTVQRCLLHLDCTIMDFDSILSLLRSNEMYSALFYVFNQGLDDFVTPLEILLERVFDEADARDTALISQVDGARQNDFARHGYKAIIYLQTCFKGKTFPQEKVLTPEDRQRTLKAELLRFLMQDSFVASPHVKRGRNGSPVVGQRALAFPYMRVLLQVDARAVFETLSLVLDAPGTNLVRTRSASESADEWVDGATNGGSGKYQLPDKQEIIDALSVITLPIPADPFNVVQSEARRPRNAEDAFLDFVAKYLVNGSVKVDKTVAFMIFARLANRFAGTMDSTDRHLAQQQAMDLLSALPRQSYDPDKVLEVINASGMHRAALLLHQQVASSSHEAGLDDIELRASHFRSAIDCYLEDEDPTFRKEVFSYAKKECSGVSAHGTVPPNGSHPRTLRDALFVRLPALVRLDSLMTARLVAELFVDELDHVIEVLEENDQGEGQFLFLQAIISGELVQVDPVAGSVLNLTMEHHHKYLALMAKLHPDMVYEYLSTHDNYRPEECLTLCQEYDIADASAYLLERMGNVSSALQLILQTLEGRMMGLKRTIRGMGVDIFRQHSARHILHGRKVENAPSSGLSSKQQREVDGVKRILIVALDLCERNSGTFASRSEHGSQLWFNVLDRLINAKGFLRLSKEQPEHAKLMAGVLSELLRLTMQRMVSSVPLSDLVRKVTSDHSGSRLGELREMVESLLGTYGFELKVFESAVTVFHHDAHGMRVQHRSLQENGSLVQAVMNVPLKPENAADVANFLRYPSRRDAALRVGPGGNACFVDNERVPYSQRAESGLANALTRLRSRRGGRESNARDSRPSGLSMMTTTEQMYEDGESEPVVYGERPVGALGEAEHRGRLMTFQ